MSILLIELFGGGEKTNWTVLQIKADFGIDHGCFWGRQDSTLQIDRKSNERERQVHLS